MTAASGHPITYEEALAVVAKEARAIPPVGAPGVCPFCFGPRDHPYTQCAGCQALKRDGAPAALLARTVPLTIAPSPGAWWNRFSTYKTTARDNVYFLAAAVAHSVTHFAADISTALSGAPTVISIVPTKRGGLVTDQGLWRLLKIIKPVIPPIEVLATFRAGQTLARGEYSPDKFLADPATLHGARVLLIEDAWISGSTAISTMGRLMEDGAASALLMPIGRRIETGAIAARPNVDAAYLSSANKPWDPSSLLWPRP